MIKLEEYGFYVINPDYLEYLYNIDSEVYYDLSYRKSMKTFLGIIVLVGNYNYFIPMTSAKEKHKKWKNVSDEHFLLYELVDINVEISKDIYKFYSNKKKIHVLSVLDIKKMIPVPNGAYEKLVFNKLKDMSYKELLKKEYQFCLSIKEKVMNKVQKIYKKQKETGIVRKANCNFLKLEKAMSKWNGIK